MTDELALSTADDIAILTICRAHKRNALHEPLWERLKEKARALAKDPTEMDRNFLMTFASHRLHRGVASESLPQAAPRL